MKKRFSTARIINTIFTLFFFAFAAFFIMPIAWVVLSSMKTGPELIKPFYTLPESIYFGNYIDVFGIAAFEFAALNSLMITVVSVFFIVLLSSMASYAIARWDNKVTYILYVLFISGMVLPFISIMVPFLRVASFFGIVGRPGLIILYVAMGMSLATFLITGFVRSSVPIEMEESMAIDGASTVQIFFFLVLPMLRPIIITVAMLNIIWVWNDYLLPSIMLTNYRMFTLPLVQTQLNTQFFQQWNTLFAAFTLSMIPMFILFFSCQRYVVKGITDGAIKG